MTTWRSTPYRYLLAPAIAQGTGYLACQLCIHSAVDEGELVCTTRRVTGRSLAPVAVCDARALGGGCGPDANHLTLSGDLEGTL